MTTYTAVTKNITTYGTVTKNSTSYSATDKSDGLFYILTDALDYILVGSASDEILISNQPTTYSALTKN